jgi:peptide deformylase
MPALTIRTFGDPVLKERARPVESFDDALRRLAGDMIETMHEAPGVGLAAPQVGRSIRLIVFDLQDDTGPRSLANPTLLNEWGEQLEEEGCLSVPGIYYPVRRFQRIHAQGFDLSGDPVSLEAEDLLARQNSNARQLEAAIAIENARLFQDLKESLEQQTATSKIFGVIAVIRRQHFEPFARSAPFTRAEVEGVQPREDLGSLVPIGWCRARGPRQTSGVREPVAEAALAFPAIRDAPTAPIAGGKRSRPQPRTALESSHVPWRSPGGGLAWL